MIKDVKRGDIEDSLERPQKGVNAPAIQNVQLFLYKTFDILFDRWSPKFGIDDEETQLIIRLWCLFVLRAGNYQISSHFLGF